MSPSAEASAARLSGRRHFAAIRRHRVRVRSGPLQFAGMPNGLAQSRVGFAIVDVRQAVTRNRIRRRLREVTREPLREHPGIDVVVRAGAEAATRPFLALAADATAGIDQLWRRIAPTLPEAYKG